MSTQKAISTNLNEKQTIFDVGGWVFLSFRVNIDPPRFKSVECFSCNLWAGPLFVVCVCVRHFFILYSRMCSTCKCCNNWFKMHGPRKRKKKKTNRCQDPLIVVMTIYPGLLYCDDCMNSTMSLFQFAVDKLNYSRQ